MTAWLRELRCAKELLDVGVVQTTLRHAGAQVGEEDIVPRSCVDERDRLAALSRRRMEELHLKSHLCIESCYNHN